MPPRDVLQRLLRYDPATGALFWLERTADMFAHGSAAAWNSQHAGKEAFTSRLPSGYRYGTIFNARLYAHRVIWVLVHGNVPVQIDHMNGLRDDNRLANLRNVSNVENRRNSRLSANNTSGVTGVVWFPRTSRWKAQICVDGVRKSLGYFVEKADAIAARLAANHAFGFSSRHGSRVEAAYVQRS